MTYEDCIHNVSDEDCYKCLLHGIVMRCAGCDDYEQESMNNGND